jgi:hypothetical protein
MMFCSLQVGRLLVCTNKTKGCKNSFKFNQQNGLDDIFQVVNLIFFNTVFDELIFQISGLMEDAGVIKLHELSTISCLYSAPAANLVGLIFLMLLFLAGNSTPTILIKYSNMAHQTWGHYS